MKIAKSFLTLLLTTLLLFTPTCSILADETPIDIIPISADTLTAQGIYADTKALASKKAISITGVYGTTSIQYALIDNGEIVISDNAGVYSKSNNTKLNEGHMYGIGSVSKMFTTSAVMKLVDEGKIGLDSPVTTYITDFKMADSRYKDITVRMLLNHSSGLLGTSYGNIMLFNDNDTQTHDELLSILSTQRLKADPGAYSVYCNDGFTLAEILVERVSTKSFTDYIHENFTKPLNMNATYTPADNFTKNNLAKIYLPLNKTELPIETFNAIGTGGIYSTAENLCKFAELFMKDSKGILSDASLEAMGNKEYLNGMWGNDGDSMLGYGLGWDSVNLYPFSRYGIKALSKGGDTSFYHANLTVIPEHNMAVAILSSGGNGTYNQIMAQEILLSALKEKGIIEEIIPNKTLEKPEKLSLPDDMKEFEGFYATSTMIYSLEMDKEGTLSISDASTQSPLAKYSYTADEKFVSQDGGSYIKFIKESNGNTYFYEGSYATVPGLGQMAYENYSAQKLEENVITDKVSKAWKKRENKMYFCISEKYSSQLYYVSMPIAKIEFIKDLPGYFANASIIDANTAKTFLNIPGTGSRDLMDYVFYTENSTEYLSANNMVFISGDKVKVLPTKSKFNVNTGKKDTVKWYKISKKSANKKITISNSENSSVSVYDKANKCIYNSYVDGNKTIILPKNGYIVFVGEVNEKFTVKYK